MFSVQTQMTSLSSDSLNIKIDGAGYVRSIVIQGGESVAPEQALSPILSLRVAGHILLPTRADWDAKKSILNLSYDGHVANVKVASKKTHLTLELVKVQPMADVELAIWGPVATTLKGSIGETIGVVQGNKYAFGLQVLNAKTLGGFPNTEDDIEPSYDIFETGNLVDMNDKDASRENYRGDTAKPSEFGSVVQAYTRNRSQTRTISNWGHPYYTAPAYRDGGVIGSKIALFGSASQDALPIIGQIEVAEGLPHPLIDGVWGKVSPIARESYLIMGFDAKNLDECLAITQAAGLKYLYSDSCFDKWGHFHLNAKGFPKNWESMKECVSRAKRQGIRLGVHTLSNFITTNDPYVTPIPDSRLAEVGASKVTRHVKSTDKEIEIESPKFFNQMSNNTLRTVRIRNELIQYESVSTAAPWRLINCKRGVFGTKATWHRGGTRVAKLMDHGYQTFLTNAELSIEVAQRIGHLFNQTGLLQLSLDGLEGNWSTGMGQYGRTLFTKSWYDALDPQLKGEVINDASNPGAFNWHIYTRMNWGEPWYAGFRKSQTLYRLKNQHYFRRNLMPGMLGWFELTSETTLEDMEWLLARAAGFDAGFCITANLGSLARNPRKTEILAAVKSWESARRLHVFPSELLGNLQDINKEFELANPAKDSWLLTPVSSVKFSVTDGPSTGEINLMENRTNAKLIVQVPSKSSVTDWDVKIDGEQARLTWPSRVDEYSILNFDLSKLSPGKHTVSVSCKRTGIPGAQVDCELRAPSGKSIELKPQDL